MFVPSLEEKIDMLSATTSMTTSKGMTPKQITNHFREGNDTENSQKNASIEDHILDYRLKHARQ